MYLNELKMRRKSTIIWSLALALLILISMVKGSAFIGDQNTASVINQIPQIFLAFYGFNGIDPTTAIGYFAIIFTFTSIAVAVHAAMNTISIFSDEEADHTYEYLMSKPVKRFEIFRAKILAVFTSVVIVNIVMAIASILSLKQFYTEGLYKEIILIQVELLFISIFFIAVALILLGLFKSAKKLGRYITIVVFLSYMISIIYDLFPKFEILLYLTPFRFFGPKLVINNEILILPYIITIIILALAYIYANNKFIKKEF